MRSAFSWFGGVAAVLIGFTGMTSALDAERALTRAELRDHEVVADSLTAAFAKNASMNSLTEMQAESLIARASALFVARLADTSEEHEALLESWGGTAWWPRDSEKGRERRNVWLEPRDRRACAQARLGESYVEVSRNEPGETVAPIKNLPGQGIGTVACQFTFTPSTGEVVKAGTIAADVYFPITTVGGDEIHMGFRLLWSEDHGNWLPASLIFRAPNEWGTPVLFF